MFRKKMETSIEIDAPAERVWEVLSDLASYPGWNPMIRRASGELRVGSRLEVRFEPEGSRGRDFRPRLTVVEEGRELRWVGRPRFPGFFDFEHYWILEDAPGGGTRLLHGSVFKGILGAFLAPLLESASRGHFEAMNRAHKARAESKG